MNLNKNIISVTITTKSNLYIGGMPQGFEIGGIDMVTATRDGRPYIPASSFKGALREICRDNVNSKISGFYDGYSDPEGRITQKHLFIFGVPGSNHTPKLIFNDFECSTEGNDLFSIDMKNSIDESDGQLTSNPRTYKAARAGLEFEGKILFRLNGLDDDKQEIIIDYVKEMCKKFNGGIYRIGNSKSRGYGHIEVKIHEDGKG
jgi:CRISPR-associated protein Csm3